MVTIFVALDDEFAKFRDSIREASKKKGMLNNNTSTSSSLISIDYPCRVDDIECVLYMIHSCSLCTSIGNI